mmetsp:Transcript_740/g.2326  ORF Transcript_740/g.2326 Transcript_740/m.2326 type:complete len:208 (+) Transcript_740:418-1041(+)
MERAAPMRRARTVLQGRVLVAAALHLGHADGRRGVERVRARSRRVDVPLRHCLVLRCPLCLVRRAVVARLAAGARSVRRLALRGVLGGRGGAVRLPLPRRLLLRRLRSRAWVLPRLLWRTSTADHRERSGRVLRRGHLPARPDLGHGRPQWRTSWRWIVSLHSGRMVIVHVPGCARERLGRLCGAFRSRHPPPHPSRPGVPRRRLAC